MPHSTINFVAMKISVLQQFSGHINIHNILKFSFFNFLNFITSFSLFRVVETRGSSQVNKYIARCFYQAGIPLSAANSESFHQMIQAIGRYGPGLKLPSYHEIRVPLLNKEVEHTSNLMMGHKEQCEKYGCSIMIDAWTDRKQKSLINFLLSSPGGTMFVKSIDASKFVKADVKLFELLDAFVEKIGEEKVVQVITDNGSNYILAGKMLEEKRKHLFWTPCAAHCVDLMLEDIGKIPQVKKAIDRGITLVGFIYSHSITLNMLRQYISKRELVRHAVTLCATSFLSLERVHEEKANLRRMFTSDEWVKCKLAKDREGKKATNIVFMPSFWNDVVFTLKAMAPLIRVLRLSMSEKKPAMGFIYKAMDKAKEAIMKSFNNNENKYKEIFEIIDNRWNCQLHRPLHAAGHFLNPKFYYSNPQLEFHLEVTVGLYECIKRLVPSQEMQHKILVELPIYKDAGGLFGSDFAKLQRKTIAPAQWWHMYGHSTPNLQQLAIKILSLTCSAFGCERDMSVFEQIHTKKRNRLEHQRLHKTVYVRYNQLLKKRYDDREEIDPISLSNIDECNEWLVGEMLDDDNGAEHKLVFENDDTLNLGAINWAPGIGEIESYTGQEARKRKGTSSATPTARVGKKGSVALTSSARTRDIGEELEDTDFEESEEQLEDTNFEESEDELEESNFEESEEEEEGYASNDDADEVNDNDTDYYIEENDTD